jgi:hypothetical protein
MIECLNADRTLDPHPTSRARLEQEYVFMGVMSTFLRAIRAGAIHVRHGAILLAHYGRLGPSFDLCSRVIVDSLREEGMLKNNGEVVTTVVTQALREVGASLCCYIGIILTVSVVVHYVHRWHYPKRIPHHCTVETLVFLLCDSRATALNPA